MRLDAMLASGDMEGQTVWLAVLDRIARLEAKRVPEEPLQSSILINTRTTGCTGGR